MLELLVVARKQWKIEDKSKIKLQKCGNSIDNMPVSWIVNTCVLT
jgi:hypothetical protein